MCPFDTNPWSWELPLSQLEPQGHGRTQAGLHCNGNGWRTSQATAKALLSQISNTSPFADP